jgi:hypothetical protein
MGTPWVAGEGGACGRGSLTRSRAAPGPVRAVLRPPCRESAGLGQAEAG